MRLVLQRDSNKTLLLKKKLSKGSITFMAGINSEIQLVVQPMEVLEFYPKMCYFYTKGVCTTKTLFFRKIFMIYRKNVA